MPTSLNNPAADGELDLNCNLQEIIFLEIVKVVFSVFSFDEEM